jgi:hypothetical protein
MTSIEIKVLITLAALGTVYVFIREIQHSARRRHLAEWVRDHYPQEWQTIDWGQRTLFIAGALARLHKRGTIGHPHFAREYPKVRRWPRDMFVAMGVAFLSIAFVGIGTQHLGWTW